MTVAAGWQPILEGSDAERAEEVVSEIAAALSAANPPPVLDEPGAITDGLPGWALFFAQLDRARPGEGHDAVARRLLDDAVERSATISGSPFLFGGITGLSWSLQHLAPLARPGHLDALDDIDAALHAALEEAPRAVGFDLMSGLVGFGVLAVERAAAPAPAAARSRLILEQLVTWLDATAEQRPQGHSWRTPAAVLHPSARAAYPSGCHQPGVAHGTAGVVGLLASLLALGVRSDDVRRLLDGAVAWLLAHELPGGQALFPLQVDAAASGPPARSAWCTGGPGISLMLWRAARAADVHELEARAHALARAAAARPLPETGVRDACLCHGTAGLAQLNARWFQATGDEFFRDESVRWLRRTLEYQRAGGVAGYATVNTMQSRELPHPGLLFGAAGIGLALLAGVSEAEPSWDRVFLMSGPPVPPGMLRR